LTFIDISIGRGLYPEVVQSGLCVLDVLSHMAVVR